MKRGTLLVFMFVALLIPRPATAVECTHDAAVQAMKSLQWAVDAGFTAMPAPDAGVSPGKSNPGDGAWMIVNDGAWPTASYVETIPDDALTRMEKNVPRVHHYTDYVRAALKGQCWVIPSFSPEKCGRSRVSCRGFAEFRDYCCALFGHEPAPAPPQNHPTCC